MERRLTSTHRRSGRSPVGNLRWGLGLALLALPVGAQAAIVPADLVAREGDVPLGTMTAVSSINPPFSLADGSAAFTGLLVGGDAYVFIDDQVVWANSDELMMVLSGTESSMGASVPGGFVYAPIVDGFEAIWTHNGLLALEGAQAAAFPAGVTVTFASRPSMIADGTAYWVAGINVSGGVTTEGRVLYRSATAMPGDEMVVLATGDMVGGLAIDSPFGIDFDYRPSANGLHLAAVLLMDTGSTANDGHLYLDGALLHQENTPNGTGDNWDNFDLVVVNDAGTYAFSGDTNGATTSDEFIAMNGVISIREGDVIDGVTLTSTAIVRFLSMSEDGRIAHAWGYGGGGTESVFYACDPADVAGSSRHVLTTGVDEVDFDGDGMGDGVVVDLNATNTSGADALTDDGHLYLEVDLDQGGTVVEAMVRIPVTCCGNGVIDDGEQCDDANADDTDDCPTTCMDSFCGDGFTWAGMEDCDDGNMADTDACLSTCVPASCGDGFLWAGVEECDDANMDDTDDCPSTCTVATCGDGFTWAGMEECDDANMDDTDACLSNCDAATCGDGIVWVGMEECDDANGDDTDDCPGNCLMATCGDGYVQAGVEECDDGNTEDGDGCESDCTVGMVTGSSSGDGGSSTGDPGDGTTSDTTSGTVGVDESGGSSGGSTSGVTPGTGTTGEGSTGDTEGPFPGLDDDGGCACRASSEHRPLRGAGWMAMLWVMAWRRRRRA